MAMQNECHHCAAPVRRFPRVKLCLDCLFHRADSLRIKPEAEREGQPLGLTEQELLRAVERAWESSTDGYCYGG